MGLFKNKEKKEEEILEEEQDFPTMAAKPIIHENDKIIKSIKEEVKEEVKEPKETNYKKTFNEEEFIEYYNILQNSENLKLFNKVVKGREEYEKLEELKEIYNKIFNKEDKQ